MNTFIVKIPVPNRQFWIAAVSVLLSVFFVAAVVYGATTIDTGSVGIATSTPGAELGVTGAGLVEGMLTVSHLKATSTTDSIFEGALQVRESATSTFTGGVSTAGLSTTGGLRVDTGAAIFDENIVVDGTASSTFAGGITIDTESFIVDSSSNISAFGTTTFPGDTADSVAPDLTINSPTATSTLFITTEGAGGSQIILKSTDGSGCIAISATRGANDIGAEAMTALTLLNVDVIACPE